MYDKNMNSVWSAPNVSSNGKDPNSLITTNAIMDKDKSMTFTTSTGGVFAFLNSDATNISAVETCDLAKMQAECGDECPGFIYDKSSNEWQLIKPDAQPSDFKIVSTMQDVYLKVPNLYLNDTSCDTGPANFVDTAFYTRAIAGESIGWTGSGQCKLTDSEAEAEYKKTIKDLEFTMKDAKQDAYDFDNSPLADIIVTKNAYDREFNKKFADLQSGSTSLGTKTRNKTLDQQKKDSEIVDEQSKKQFAVWLIFALLFVAFILTAWFGGFRATLYTFGIVAILYLGYRFLQ